MNRTNPGGMPTGALQLHIIRASLLMGVLLFAAVTWHIRSQGTPPPQPDGGGIGMAVLGVWAVVTVMVIFASRRYNAVATRQERTTWAIIGWSLGEAAGMAGTVYYFMTGDPTRFFIGLVMMVVVLRLFPVPPDEPAAE